MNYTNRRIIEIYFNFMKYTIYKIYKLYDYNYYSIVFYNYCGNI